MFVQNKLRLIHVNNLHPRPLNSPSGGAVVLIEALLLSIFGNIDNAGAAAFLSLFENVWDVDNGLALHIHNGTIVSLSVICIIMLSNVISQKFCDPFPGKTSLDLIQFVFVLFARKHTIFLFRIWKRGG